MELTKEQFILELEMMNLETTRFNVSSIDSYGLSVSLYECKIEFGEYEITFFKPYAIMQVDIEFDSIDAIIKEDDCYCLEFNSGKVADIEISVAK